MDLTAFGERGRFPARTDDFDFALPASAIAQVPVEPRDAARLLVLGRHDDTLVHGRVSDLPRWLRPGDLLVLNDTRVLASRVLVRRPTGARLEFLFLHPEGEGDPGAAPRGPWRALVKPLRRVRLGEWLTPERPSPVGGAGGPRPGEVSSHGTAADAVRLRVAALGTEGEVVVEADGPLAMAGGIPSVLRVYGRTPLPPYIRAPMADPERYQTVYGRAEGSAAAPTAGLHFTPRLLAALDAVGVARASVTLHVGVGTFRPVQTERPEDHRLHAEWLHVPPATAEAVAACRARGGRVVAVGTTVMRTLEARADPSGRVQAGSGWTDLYILPGYRFRVVEGLLTNFHLPRSTLLMLVCAFGGRERVLDAYREAVRVGYRFYSFGDAMLLL